MGTVHSSASARVSARVSTEAAPLAKQGNAAGSLPTLANWMAWRRLFLRGSAYSVPPASVRKKTGYTDCLRASIVHTPGSKDENSTSLPLWQRNTTSSTWHSGKTQGRRQMPCRRRRCAVVRWLKPTLSTSMLRGGDLRVCSSSFLLLGYLSMAHFVRSDSHIAPHASQRPQPRT